MNKKWYKSIFRKNESGTVAVITALTLPLLIGGLAIAVDGGYWRYRVSILQNVADMTAESLAIDINNSITNVVTLNTNAVNESQKNGCNSSCAIVVTYPYKLDAGAVSVNITDNNATRFFSGIYETSQKVLTVKSSAHTSTAGSGYTGSSCILATAKSPPIHNGAIDVEGSGTQVDGCELISNASGTSSIYLDASGVINALGTAVGYVKVMPNGSPPPSITAKQENHVATADPYDSLYNSSNISSALLYGQFNSSYKPGTAIPGKCLEIVISGNVQSIDWSQDASTVLNQSIYWYTSSVGSDGRRIHNFGSGLGGGVFCADQSFSNVVVNISPGAWFFLRNLAFMNHTTVNALGTTTARVSSNIPNTKSSVGTTTTNGATIVLGNNNFTLGDNSEMHLRSPTAGPFSGIALAGYTDLATIKIEFSGNSILELSGMLYAPTDGLRVQNGGNFYSMAGSDGTRETGCTHLIAASFDILSKTTIRNKCAGAGLQPFGTQPSGWAVTAGSTPAVKARMIP